jgi:cytochrome c oxidase assembly protein subunit 15
MKKAALKPHPQKKRLSVWLYGNCALLLAMILLGGITRLQGAGLSIVEWEPIMGILPPLFQEDWVILFAKYQQSPEFQKINFMFTLNDFKSIFWLEYFHRLLGRALGLTFMLPGFIFWAKGYLTPKLKKNFLIICTLGLLQGGMGWYMVKSGLVDDPHVSHFRLAAHLVLAFIIYACMLWQAFSLTCKRGPDYYVQKTFRLILIFLFITIIYGAFVAGLKAGLIYNTFPLMDGAWFPHHILSLAHEKYFVYDPVNIQFIHRWLAIILAVWIIWSSLYYIREVHDRHLKKTFWVLQGIVLLQFMLGVATLIFVTPAPLACLHQLGAATLLSAILYVLYYTGMGRAERYAINRHSLFSKFFHQFSVCNRHFIKVF